MKQLLNISNRAQRIRFAHEKKSMGMNINEIALILRTSPRTVEKYLNTNPETVKDRQIAKEMKHVYLISKEQRKSSIENLPIIHIVAL